MQAHGKSLARATLLEILQNSGGNDKFSNGVTTFQIHYQKPPSRTPSPLQIFSTTSALPPPELASPATLSPVSIPLNVLLASPL